MVSKSLDLPREIYGRFRAFHELMANKIREILLVSSPYDAFIMEEDGSLASRIINEYSGLNLSQPPRVTRTSSAYAALEWLNEKKFDMVICTPHLAEMDAFSLGLEIKKVKPELPVILLAHSLRAGYPPSEDWDCSGIDKTFIWSGNSDLLLALVKNAEDRLNIDFDTKRAKVRVLILVEDSPVYYSSFLPLIYKEVVKQTQAVLELGLNEEHRLLTMRARPKILLAENYEEALELYHRYQSYLFGIISDARIPRGNSLDGEAGVLLLSQIRKEIPDLPLLLMSSESKNREKAEKIPAVFLDKNSSNLLGELHDFFMNHLGFGDFVFRLPDATTYRGRNAFSGSTPISLRGRSRTCPIEATTLYPLPSMLAIVLALAGDSTTTRLPIPDFLLYHLILKTITHSVHPIRPSVKEFARDSGYGKSARRDTYTAILSAGGFAWTPRPRTPSTCLLSAWSLPTTTWPSPREFDLAVSAA